MNPKRGVKAWLLGVARSVAAELKTRIEGTSLRIRMPSQIKATFTDGWAAIIGDLGSRRPSLEIWLDHFSGYDDRKLWACFSGGRGQLRTLTKHVGKHLVPTRVITTSDTTHGRFLVLSKPLGRSGFNVPILEKHADDQTFLGVYDRTKKKAEKDPFFVSEAASFFESVARALPQAKPEEEAQSIFPRCENRIKVAIHLRRERNRMLAAARKRTDGYECQVCKFRFADLYGKLGVEFAEAHHLIPLSKLRENVRTRIEDLITVCANCHRMLHQMDGESGDVRKLRITVRKHRQS